MGDKRGILYALHTPCQFVTGPYSLRRAVLE